MTEKRLDFSKLSLKTDDVGDLTVEGARDVLDILVQMGCGDFELLIGYDDNYVYTGFTDEIYLDDENKKILVKE